MTTKFYKLLLSSAFSLVTSAVFGQMATNPLLFADVPDPDVVRVGDTYYMSSTTMHFNPGIPIMKSNDLVNWELVNYCYPIMANTDALNLQGGMEAYSGGTWASSINYHQGTFYVSSFSYSTGKTYVYKTTNIETGPWTTITLNKVYHDHSLFFDEDGKVYFAYGHDNIQLTEMKPDLTGEQPGGVNKVIIPKASSVAGSNMILTAEGTRIQKINGTYYVSNICWPSGKGRTQIIHRSSTIAGTYTGRLAFQSSNGSAQGEYIDTPEGKWYAMFFHDHGAVGRIPDLMPVTWNSGWPTVGVNGQVPATLDIPKGAGSLKGVVASDEFSTAPPLKLQWQWNHNPRNDYWSLAQRSGYLRLTNERTDANVLRTTNTLTQRTFGPKSAGYVAVDVSGMKDGDYTGLLALQNKYGFVGVKMVGTSKSIVRVDGTGFNGMPTEVASVPLNQQKVYLRIDFDFTNRTDKAYFFYSLTGTSWTALGSALQMNYDLEHFVGYRFGLFTYATKSTGGHADFDFFRVGATISEAQDSTVVPVSQTAFGGTPHPIPGIIQAEHYDLGGEGVAYHEANRQGNEGGATLRNDEVDLEATGDVSGSYNVGYILSGEWLEYTVHVASSETYDVSFRLASDGAGKVFHMEMDGLDVTGSILVPATGAWQSWETVIVPGIALTAGVHVIRIAFDADYFNLNWFAFQKASITGLEVGNIQQPLLYPNPFHDGIQVSCPHGTDYQIMDLTGKETESGSLNHPSVVGKSLPKGAYILKLTGENNSHAIKILKQ